MPRNFKSDENKTTEEINEEIEQAFASGEFDESDANKPQFLSLKFIVMLAILAYLIYKMVQTII